HTHGRRNRSHQDTVGWRAELPRAVLRLRVRRRRFGPGGTAGLRPGPDLGGRGVAAAEVDAAGAALRRDHPAVQPRRPVGGAGRRPGRTGGGGGPPGPGRAPPHGAGPGLDIVAEGETPADDEAAAAAHVTPWAHAGCTWWIENRWQMPEGTTDPIAVVRERLAAGPPLAA